VADYDRAANNYCRRLPLEHFMEGLPQSTQRRIALESLDLLRARLPDVQVFNELLIQYWFKGRLRRVVPDNMVRRSRAQLHTGSSFNVELETEQPFLVLEYVSPANYRKDSRDSFLKYERELRVPYCLIFYPEKQDLQLHHLEGEEYQRVPANAHGRYAIPELDLEVGLLDGWVRFWHRGELLPLPADLEKDLFRERARAEQEKQRADQEKQRAEQEKQRGDQENQRAEHEKQRAEQEKERADLAQAEVARLRALLEQAQAGEPKPRRPRKPKPG
jgi:Uma2 family endonuclease